MIDVGGKQLRTVDEIVAWFVDASVTRRGVEPWQDDVGEVLSMLDYSPELAEVAVRVLDAGPAPARAAMCNYLKLRPVEDPPLRDAWLGWVRPPAPWLDEKTPGGTPLGVVFAGAAESCALARTQPAVAEAFLDLADRFGTWRLWTLALAQGDPRGRGPEVLRRGIAAGVRLTPGEADMLAWRYGRDAPERLAVVADALVTHPVEVRASFLAEAQKHVASDAHESLRAAVGMT